MHSCHQSSNSRHRRPRLAVFSPRGPREKALYTTRSAALLRRRRSRPIADRAYSSPRGTHDLLAGLLRARLSHLLLGRRGRRVRRRALGLGSPLLGGLDHGGEGHLVVLLCRRRHGSLLSLGLRPALLAGVGFLAASAARVTSSPAAAAAAAMAAFSSLVFGPRFLPVYGIFFLARSIERSRRPPRLPLGGGRRPPWPPSPPWSWARASFRGTGASWAWGRLVLLREPLGKDGHGLLGKHEEQGNVVGGARAIAARAFSALDLGPRFLPE